MRQTARQAHWAIWVRKEMVKMPLMNLKYDLQMTRGQTRSWDEDIAVERCQSLVATPPNGQLSFFCFAMER